VSTEADIAAYRAHRRRESHRASGRRRREEHKAASEMETTITIAQAHLLLPDIIARHGDTPLTQAIHRRRLELEP
jgi:hypothetical protein